MDINELKKQLEEKPKQEKSRKINDFDVDIKKYEDLDDFSTGKIDFGLWVLERRQLLKRIFMGFLIFVSVLTWSYSLFGFGHYLLIGMKEDSLQMREFIGTKTVSYEYLLSRMPVDISYSRINAINTDGQKYDFSARVKNLNQDHYGYIEYCFNVFGQEDFCAETFILPDTEKYVLILNQELANRPQNVGFFIKEMKWKRINKHKIRDWKLFYEERSDFIVSDKEFEAVEKSGSAETASINRLQFKIENRSPFNYWSLPLNITLHKGGNTVAVNKYVIDGFSARSIKEIVIVFPEKINNIDFFEVEADIDFLDEKIYMNF